MDGTALKQTDRPEKRPRASRRGSILAAVVCCLAVLSLTILSPATSLVSASVTAPVSGHPNFVDITLGGLVSSQGSPISFNFANSFNEQYNVEVGSHVTNVTITIETSSTYDDSDCRASFYLIDKYGTTVLNLTHMDSGWVRRSYQEGDFYFLELYHVVNFVFNVNGDYQISSDIYEYSIP